MIEIKKGREPDKLLRYRQQNGASYEQTDKEVKEELLGKLLEEQGHDSYVGYVKLSCQRRGIHDCRHYRRSHAGTDRLSSQLIQNYEYKKHHSSLFVISRGRFRGITGLFSDDRGKRDIYRSPFRISRCPGGDYFPPR